MRQTSNPLSTYEVDRLSELTKDSIIVGIGNCLRSDDAFGSVLARRLKGAISLRVFDTGVSPENYLGIIIKEKPDTILFIDAVNFGGSVAEVRLLDSNQVKTQNFFLTHNASIELLFNFINNQINSKLYLLAVQPKSIKLKEGMSQEISELLEKIFLWFKGRYPFNA